MYLKMSPAKWRLFCRGGRWVKEVIGVGKKPKTNQPWSPLRQSRVTFCIINSLRFIFNDAIWRHWFGFTLAQVMATPSHHYCDVIMGAMASQITSPTIVYLTIHCPACRTTLIATRFRVAVICPIIQVPHCIRVFFYFVWFVFINHIFQFHYELCTYCNILDIYLS